VQSASRFRPDGMARLALYATPICLAAFVGLVYFTYFKDGSDSSSLQSGSVQISGSETMRPVVTTCAEEFMTRNPKADIIVKGGGSGDGIAALLHGIVDIGMMSRELSPRERDYAASKNIPLSVSELALDGVTVIVNRAIAVTALGLGQLQAMEGFGIGASWKPATPRSWRLPARTARERRRCSQTGCCGTKPMPRRSSTCRPMRRSWRKSRRGRPRSDIPISAHCSAPVSGSGRSLFVWIRNRCRCCRRRKRYDRAAIRWLAHSTS
jgi:hypothetical protein